MLKVNLTGTKDGVNVTFTLASTSVTGGLTFIVHNGVIQKIVTSAPAVGECSISGTTVTMGQAPEAAHSLWAFTQNALTKGLKRITIDGNQNGSNTSFALSETPVAGSNIILLVNGVVQEEVAAGATAGQFTISGTTITFGLAPVAGWGLFVYAEETATIFIRKVTVTPTPNGGTTKFKTNYVPPNGFSPLFLVLHNGIVQQQIPDGTPSTGSFLLLPDFSIRVGLPPESTHMFEVYVVGLEVGIVSNIYQVTCGKVANRLLILTQKRLNITECELAVDTAYRLLLDSYQWSHLYVEGAFATEALKSAGTVSVVKDSTVVTGANTGLLTTDVGRYFRISTQSSFYTITNITNLTGGTQIIEISPPYVSATASAQSYQVFRTLYQLSTEVEYLFSMSSEVWMSEITVEELDRIDPTRASTNSYPSFYVHRDRDSVGRLQVEIYPVPTAGSVVRWVGMRRDICEGQDHALRGLESVMLYAAAQTAFLEVAAKAGQETPWLLLSDRYGVMAARAVEQLSQMDLFRAGVSQVQKSRGMRGPWDDSYAQTHDTTLRDQW